jgi:hypothetical protein
MTIANVPVATAKSSRAPDPKVHLEGLLDEALEETFPASDPISPSTESSERHPDSGKTALLARGPVGLDPVASWDADRRVFRIRVHHSPRFAELVILQDAPLPLAHLGTSTHHGKTILGTALHTRLEGEVNAAIARGGQQVATGIFLLTHEERNRL